MAPIKFEEHIKEKLEQRKLQPSNVAWQKLSNQLDADVSKKNSKSFWWLAIAASFVGVLITVSVLMNSEEKNTTPIIVDTETINKLDKKSDSNKDEILVDKEDKIATTKISNEQKNQIKKEQTQKVTKQPILKLQLKKEQKQIIPVPIKKAVVEAANKNEIQNLEQTNESLKILTFEEQKIKEVVAEITKLKDNNSTVSDSEIDSLLNRAQKDIVKNKIFNELTKTVDANALLQDVEEDLEQSFRNKVFEALKINYKKVKTAVAERNN
jgi:hypothetical protein